MIKGDAVNEQLLNRYFKVCVEKANKVRVDVEQIRSQLGVVSDQLNRNLTDEKSLFSKLRNVQRQQASFHERVQQACENLKIYKSFLASYNS